MFVSLQKSTLLVFTKVLCLYLLAALLFFKPLCVFVYIVESLCVLVFMLHASFMVQWYPWSLALYIFLQLLTRTLNMRQCNDT